MLVCDPAVFLEIKKPKTKTTKKKNRKTIGINIAAHGWKMQDKHLTKVIKAYTGFCLKLEKLNYKIVYFKHSPGEEKAIEELEKKVKLRVIRGSSKKLLKEYKKVDYFIGMMLHSTILAFNANKPMISICYDHKNHDFMKLIGMNKYYLHYNKLNSKKIFELFQKLKENENKIQKNFKKKKKLLWKAHERFLRKVDKIRK